MIWIQVHIRERLSVPNTQRLNIVQPRFKRNSHPRFY